MNTAATHAHSPRFLGGEWNARVVEPHTEGAWVAAARGKNLRQVEELVTSRRPGDPQDPEIRTRVVRFELTAETFARLRQARQTLDNEHGSNLPDEQFVGALCGAVLRGEGGLA